MINFWHRLYPSIFEGILPRDSYLYHFQKEYNEATMHDLMMIFKSIGLFITEWVLILVFYITGIYSLVFFQEIFLDINAWPLPSMVRSLVMILWATIPVAVVAFVINKYFLQIPKRLFWMLQAAFVVTVWLGLTINIWIATW